MQAPTAPAAKGRIVPRMSNPYAQGVRPTMFAQARKGARFRRARLLIIGCGDVGQRVLQLLPVRTRAVQVLALTSTPHKAPMLRALGAQPLVGDLDEAASLRRLAGVAQYVLHLAPPPGQGTVDTRTQALLRALGRGRAPRALVYVSTTGVYGDCAGADRLSLMVQYRRFLLLAFSANSSGFADQQCHPRSDRYRFGIS